MSATIGTMRHRITLQRPRIANDDYGVPSTTWVDVATVWAAFSTKINSPRAVGERNEVVTNYQFDIRHRTDVRNDWQVVWNGRVLTINGAADLDGTEKYLRILTEERQ